jgi:hypothetical protein
VWELETTVTVGTLWSVPVRKLHRKCKRRGLVAASFEHMCSPADIWK